MVFVWVLIIQKQKSPYPKHDKGFSYYGCQREQVVIERVTRLELVISAWEARVLPLHYTRVAHHW